MNAPVWFLPATLVAALLATPAPAGACAVAPPRDVVVEVASESAIVVWDAKTKTQHFIRRATFAPHAPGSVPVKDFGFLVPTPAVPQLEEVDDRAFDELAKVTAPRTETRARPAPAGGCGCGNALMAPKSVDLASGGVEVLSAKTVAGYDAVSLKAGDAGALTAWLTERGYEVRPALTAWLKPYLEKKWVITAFKISTDPAAGASAAVGSAAVRMTFATEAPLFPYREPEDMRDAKTRRLLRVFVIADQKVSGALADASWEGKTVWSAKPGAEGWKGVLPHLKIQGFQPTDATWLTEFEDASSPRKGTSDLTFAPAGDETVIQRPVRIIYAAAPGAGAKPAFALVGVAVAGLFVTRFLTGRATRR